MFKKIKFQVGGGSIVSTYEGENRSLESIIEILKDPNVISISATKMTVKEYLKGKKPINSK